MADFRAAEFSGLPYAVGPDMSYAEILGEACSELRRIAGFGEPTRYARLSLSIANAGRRVGDFATTEAALGDATRIFAAAGDLIGTAWTAWSRGNHHQQLGRHSAAACAFEAAFKAARSAGDAPAASYALAGWAEILRITGNYPVATAAHLVLRERFRAAGDYRGIIWANEGVAQIEMRRGHISNASRLFEQARLDALAVGDRRGLAWAMRGAAEVLLRSGQACAAAEQAALARIEFVNARLRIGEGYSLLTTARAQGAVGDGDQRSLTLGAAIALFKECRHERGAAYARDEFLSPACPAKVRPIPKLSLLVARAPSLPSSRSGVTQL